MTDKQDFVSGNVDYHQTLSPLAWEDNTLRSEVQLKLLEIARAFVGYLEIPNFKIEDIVLTGSMANYNYTKFSDFDVHVVTRYADLECDDIAEAFYRAKKEIWNNEHDITIRGHDAELYVEDTATPPVSGGMYSILRDQWITEPEYNPPKVNNTAVNAKVRDLIKQIQHAIAGDAVDIEQLRTKIRNMRKAGLESGGEFGVENLSFKILRNQGYLTKLHNAQTKKIDKQLSLESADKVFSSEQVLAYVKKIHDNFHIDHAIDTHPQWVLKMLPVDNLKGPSEDDPYNRDFDLNQDHVASITPNDIKSRAIVVDNDGCIIDGNHRHAAAKQYGMSHMPAFVPHKGINEDVVNEGASAVLYHYANIRAALNIINTGHFELSSVTGNKSEEQYAPDGYPYFLSLTRTRVGDYHRYVGNGGVLFVVDGNWFNRNHKVTPIDYWERAWQSSPDRSREAEDRVFSKTPTIPIDSVQEVHVLLKEKDKWRSPEARQLMIASKRSGIATYFYVDEKNWRLLNKAKSISVKDAGGVLGGQMPTKPMYSPERDYLEPWLELIYKNSKVDLTDRAEKTRYNLVYYGSRYRNEDSGLGGDLSNARKPDQGASRQSAIKIIDYMIKNGHKTPLDLKNFLSDKWEKIADLDRAKTESVNEAAAGEYVYHASYLPNPSKGLQSVISRGLVPSKDGYAGPGVYFAYTPDGGYYHVDKEDATLFRAKWSMLSSKFGTYPENPNGIQRDDEEIVVPGVVPADMLEVEYFPGEWWDLKSALTASRGPVDETQKSITELFEPGKNWEWSFRGSEEAVAVFRVGEVPYMFHAYGADGDWEVEFKRHGSKLDRLQKFGLTGTGNSAEVMGTVVDIMRSFLSQYKDKIDSLTFSAKEDSRQGLYARMVKRLLPNWAMRQHGESFVLLAPEEVTQENIKEVWESLNEGGWASTETQNTVITPKTVAEIIEVLKGFERSYNTWQENNGLDTEIKIGSPKGSGTYFRRDLEQDPTREYGDVDVECFIHSRDGLTSAQRITEYKKSITEYCSQSPDFSTDNGTNIIMRTTDGPVQVDLIYTYHEHANWSRALSPEYRVKGVISTSLTSSLAEVLNLSFSSQGVQVKIRNDQPVSFRQSKDTELRTVSIDPETWAQDIYSLYYYLSHGEKPSELPRALKAHGGLKDEQRLSDIVLSIKALASGLEDAGLLGHGSLIGIQDKLDLIRKVATVYSTKLETAENSSKFNKAETPAAVEKAKKTKLMLAKYRNEVTKLLLN
jgi:hypothetical protein